MFFSADLFFPDAETFSSHGGGNSLGLAIRWVGFAELASFAQMDARGRELCEGSWSHGLTMKCHLKIHDSRGKLHGLVKGPGYNL